MIHTKKKKTLGGKKTHHVLLLNSTVQYQLADCPLGFFFWYQG